MEGIEEISETLLPYARNRSSVWGSSSPNNAPNLRAVLWSDPSSASVFLLREMVAPKPLYSTGASSLTNVKSKLSVAKAAEFSLCTVANAVVIRPIVNSIRKTEGWRLRDLVWLSWRRGCGLCSYPHPHICASSMALATEETPAPPHLPGCSAQALLQLASPEFGAWPRIIP